MALRFRFFLPSRLARRRLPCRRVEGLRLMIHCRRYGAGGRCSPPDSSRTCRLGISYARHLSITPLLAPLRGAYAAACRKGAWQVV